MSALVIAPLLEEAVFRLIPFRLTAACPDSRRRVALGSATLFGLMHQRFGVWFVGYALSGGLVLWATYARAGYLGAVVLHLAANLADLSLGWRRRLYANSGRRRPTPR
ncbi:MAG: CPBP family intramembrane metalloprotease [Chloroflexota bacterium]|nr:CPBP family intramembrane metalloprotease [Chloroflexota bacterium]